MIPVTAPLAPLDGLLDRERSLALHAGGQVFDLATVSELARRLSERGLAPRRPRLAVHVAGSEGKTSLVERLAAGLLAAGQTVGTFTSPHLIDPVERLRVDLELPDAGAAGRAASTVADVIAAMQPKPSWFEALWATGGLLFSDLGVDAVIWEAGLGGRLDATRLSAVDLCVITSISLEHTAILGDTIEEIAAEKAGILREGVPVVVAAGVPAAARRVIADRAAELSCELIEPAGHDQDRASQLALAVLEWAATAGLFPGWHDGVRAAVTNWRVAGAGDTDGAVVFDRAHSVAAVEDLARRLASRSAGPVVLGVTHGRDGSAMARALLAVAAPLIVTCAPGPRGLPPDELVAGLPLGNAQGQCLIEPDPHRALERARELLAAAVPDPGRRIHVTGSLYLVGRLMPSGSPAP